MITWREISVGLDTLGLGLGLGLELVLGWGLELGLGLGLGLDTCEWSCCFPVTIVPDSGIVRGIEREGGSAIFLLTPAVLLLKSLGLGLALGPGLGSEISPLKIFEGGAGAVEGRILAADRLKSGPLFRLAPLRSSLWLLLRLYKALGISVGVRVKLSVGVSVGVCVGNTVRIKVKYNH
jgi:hypothetical protein